MYSYKQRKKAIETYRQTKSVSKTLQILGYPSSKELYKWIHEYQQNGELHKKRVKPERIYYNEEEKAAAVQFYHDNKGSYQDAANKLGYPSSAQLRLWVKAAEKEKKKACEISPYMIEYTKENFIKAAIAFCANESDLVTIGNKYHIAPNTIKKASAVLLGKEYQERMHTNMGTKKNRLTMRSTKALNSLWPKMLHLQKNVPNCRKKYKSCKWNVMLLKWQVSYINQNHPLNGWFETL